MAVNRRSWPYLLIVALGLAAAGCEVMVSNPTPTPAPRPSGEGTVEDLRAMIVQWPAEHKLVVDEDIVVLFPPPESIPMWVGMAFIHHIPSKSVVILYPTFGRNPFDYRNEEGRQRLEAVIADQTLMQRILERIPGAANSDRGMFDPWEPNFVPSDIETASGTEG